MIAFLNAKRSAAHQDKDGVTFGLPNEVAVDAFKYLITINIKVVDKVWMWLSPLLSNRENWRTDVELKSAMGLKLFAVKFIIFYYPFFYTLFIQPYGVGCPGGEIRGRMLFLRARTFSLPMLGNHGFSLLLLLVSWHHTLLGAAHVVRSTVELIPRQSGEWLDNSHKSLKPGALRRLFEPGAV